MVTENRLAADDEGQGKRDRKLEFEGFEAGHGVVFFCCRGVRGWGAVFLCGIVGGVVLVDAADVDDAHEKFGKPDIVHLDFDVFLEGILGGDAAGLAKNEVKK